MLKLTDFMKSIAPKLRRHLSKRIYVLIAAHLLIFAISYEVALWLRFDFAVSENARGCFLADDSMDLAAQTDDVLLHWQFAWMVALRDFRGSGLAAESLNLGDHYDRLYRLCAADRSDSQVGVATGLGGSPFCWSADCAAPADWYAKVGCPP